MVHDLRMQSRWSDAHAREFVARYAAHGEDLALRVYTSRLIGEDADLVLHGGGEKPAFLSAAQPAPVAKTASPATTAHTTQEAPGG